MLVGSNSGRVKGSIIGTFLEDRILHPDSSSGTFLEEFISTDDVVEQQVEREGEGGEANNLVFEHKTNCS
jgi:hypothetical protein